MIKRRENAIVALPDYQIPINQLVQVGPRIFNLFQEYL